ALWQQRALAGMADLGGSNPARLIAALAARPYATAEDLAHAASVSRDTAERLLPKLHARGLLREITGRGRYRLWAAG
ncbi:helix-turn-helix domain-containing protein, partial [Cereibacter sp. SYSU M97828]|nr:helix-turn-helix domain-containing protein [Cereibacter flavus]